MKPRGRPIVPEAERLHIFNIRLTTAQIAKLAALGGPAWIRKKIDRSKVIVPLVCLEQQPDDQSA